MASYIDYVILDVCETGVLAKREMLSNAGFKRVWVGEKKIFFAIDKDALFLNNLTGETFTALWAKEAMYEPTPSYVWENLFGWKWETGFPGWILKMIEAGFFKYVGE